MTFFHRWFYKGKTARAKATIRNLEGHVADARAESTDAEAKFRDALDNARRDLDARAMVAGALVWKNRRHG